MPVGALFSDQMANGTPAQRKALLGRVIDHVIVGEGTRGRKYDDLRLDIRGVGLD